MHPSHVHLSLADPEHPSQHFFAGDFVWVFQRSPDWHLPVLLGNFLGKCAVEFIPAFTALSPFILSPQVYHICCNHIERSLTGSELAVLSAHPECAELTCVALFAAFPLLCTPQAVVVKQE